MPNLKRKSNKSDLDTTIENHIKQFKVEQLAMENQVGKIKQYCDDIITNINSSKENKKSNKKTTKLTIQERIDIIKDKPKKNYIGYKNAFNELDLLYSELLDKKNRNIDSFISELSKLEDNYEDLQNDNKELKKIISKYKNDLQNSKDLYKKLQEKNTFHSWDKILWLRIEVEFGYSNWLSLYKYGKTIIKIECDDKLKTILQKRIHPDDILDLNSIFDKYIKDISVDTSNVYYNLSEINRLFQMKVVECYCKKKNSTNNTYIINFGLTDKENYPINLIKEIL